MSTILEPAWAAQRQAMVAQLRAYGITDKRILCAKAKVPRHEFIPEDFPRKQGGRLIRTADLPVRFVPMVHGEEGGP
jgi:hypothetical protein